MRARHLVLPVVALALASCGSPEPEATPEPATVTASAEETTPEPTEKPTTEPPSDEELLEQCEAPETQGPIGEAVLTADLPGTTRILSVEEFPPSADAEDQDSTWVEVEICSVPLNSDEHRQLATDIARAALDAEGPGIYRISVALLMPTTDGTLREGRVIYLEDVQTVMEWADPAIMNTWRTV